ncbi:MAG TPA: Na+/H+ antiporter NhaC family protein [Steroidobacteraceae bacterium]|nr:Na+/H+ antiporter NhaC family protein [Steroidobacteraceae bacterium]
MTPTAPTTTRPLTMAEAAIPIVALIVLVGLSFYLFGDEGAKGPNQVALVMASLVALVIGRRAGYTAEQLRDAAVASVTTGVSAIFILFAVGALTGAWAMSGTLMAMVYYGLQILSPHYFYMTSAILCAIIAFSIGSSWTVAATIGIGLVGIAVNMELSPAVTAGAVISGAYFGDKSSPLSDTANLAAAVGGAELYQHLREVLWTSIPALGITLLIFFFMGSPGDFDATEKLESIRTTFDVSLVHFLPLLVVIVLAVLRFPPFTTIMMGALAGAVLAVVTAPERVIAFAADPDLATPLALLKGAWLALASGYTSTTGYEAIDMLASRGGMERMLDTIWLIIVALAFGGVVEKAGAIERLIAPVLAAVKSNGSLVAATVGSTVVTNAVTADQYIAIVLPGRMFKGAFQKRGLAPVVLSRSLGDSATVTSALIPWNSCGAFMAATLGVATVAYAPFTFFNLLSPLISVAMAFLGIRMLKAPSPESSSKS